jgi:hypothetical protein
MSTGLGIIESNWSIGKLSNWEIEEACRRADFSILHYQVSQ